MAANLNAALQRLPGVGRVVIPNADLFTDRVTVKTAHAVSRRQHGVGIGYGDDLTEAKRVIRETLADLKLIRQDPAAEVLGVDLAGSSVNRRVRGWVDPPGRQDAMDSQDGVLWRVKDALPAHGIHLPYPTWQMLWHDQTEETGGNRKRPREGWLAGGY